MSTPNHLDRPVRSVTVVIHAYLTSELDNYSENHATLYLHVGGDRSVQFNMRTHSDYIEGDLLVLSREYVTSDTGVRFETHHVMPNRTITSRQFESMLRQSRFSEYVFTNGGIGCRYWCLTILLWMGHLGILDTRWVLRTHAVLSFKYSRSGHGPMPWPIQQGTFEDARTQQAASRLWRGLILQARQALQALIAQAARSSPSREAAMEQRRLETQLREMVEAEQRGAALWHSRATGER